MSEQVPENQQLSLLEDPFYQHLLGGGTIRSWYELRPDEAAEIVISVINDESIERGLQRSAAWTEDGWSYKLALELGIFRVDRDEHGEAVAVVWIGEDHLQGGPHE